MAEHVELAVRALADAGATVVADAVPAHLAEALDITQRYWGRRQLSGTEADDLLWDWDRFRRRQLVFAQTVDIVVSPASADVAALVSQQNPGDVYTLPPRLTGAPAAAIRPGSTERFRSASSSSGDAGTTATVLAAARVIETAVVASAAP